MHPKLHVFSTNSKQQLHLGCLFPDLVLSWSAECKVSENMRKRFKHTSSCLGHNLSRVARAGLGVSAIPFVLAGAVLGDPLIGRRKFLAYAGDRGGHGMARHRQSHGAAFFMQYTHEMPRYPLCLIMICVLHCPAVQTHSNLSAAFLINFDYLIQHLADLPMSNLHTYIVYIYITELYLDFSGTNSELTCLLPS